MKVHLYLSLYLNIGGEHMAELPKATIKRVFKDAGAERVSGDVPDQVNKIVEAIAEGAVESCEADGRKTVKADDLKLVVVPK